MYNKEEEEEDVVVDAERWFFNLYFLLFFKLLTIALNHHRLQRTIDVAPAPRRNDPDRELKEGGRRSNSRRRQPTRHPTTQ